MAMNKTAIAVFLAAALACLVPAGAACADEAAAAAGQSSKVYTTGGRQTVDAPSASLADGVYTMASSLNDAMLVEIPGGSQTNAVQARLYSANSTPAQRWRISADGKGLYTIVNVNSGKVLDLAGAKAAKGAKVQQYRSNGTLAQKWKIEADGNGYVIRSAVDKAYVLDVAGGKAARGQALQLYKSNGTAAQRFNLTAIKQLVKDGFYTVSNKNSNRVLDIADGSLANGGNVQQYQANGSLAQTFLVSFDKDSGYYSLVSAGSGKALDVAGGSVAAGANVQQHGPNKTMAQYWDFQKAQDGSFAILSAKSGKALDVQQGSTANGANVRIWTSNGTAAQRWVFASKSDWLPEGAYYFHNGKVHGNVAAVADMALSNGANILMQAKSASNAQRFYLRKAGSGYYTIQNVYSGKYVSVASASSKANVAQTGSATQWKPVLADNGIVFQAKGDSRIVLDMANGTVAAGANVQVYNANGSLAQKWLLKATDLLADGTYTASSAASTNLVLDNPSNSQADGTVLQVWPANKTAAQVFALKRVGPSTYRITNAGSNKALAASGSSVVQQAPASSAAQQWALQLNANGSMSLLAKGSGKAATLGSSAKKGAKVALAAYGGKPTQNWLLRAAAVPKSDGIAAGTTSYCSLSITMAQMAAIEGVSSYYLDPANLSKYQFLDLRTYTGTSAEDLDRALHNLAPWIAQGNPLYKSGKYFVEAAKKYNVNEVFLMIHAGQETGWGEAAYFGGYYNFYGVDGGAGTASGAASNAAARGWTTVEKGIVGGAKYLAEEWIYRKDYPQHSPYGLRYDYHYVDKKRAYSFHHYTTNGVWLTTTADHIAQVYNYLGTGKKASFVYPKYKSA